MPVITPTQSREARRELGISQADVAGAVGINRAYLSDFESGNLVRLTKSQLRKLRSHYEEKIAAAKGAGDEIEITFGEVDPEIASFRVESVEAKQCVFPVGKEVSDEVVASTLATIADIDKQLAGILNSVAEREQALFGPGEFSEDTLAAFRESFSLLAAAYLLVRAIGGWPEIGLSAANMNIAESSVLAALMGQVGPYFEQAGLTGGQKNEKQEAEEVEA